MGIKLLLFDAAGVLFPANTAVGDSLKSKYNLTAGSLKFWLDLHVRLSKGEITTEYFLDEFSVAYNIPRDQVSQAGFTEPFESKLLPIPGTRKLLDSLSASGHTLALLSDTAEMYAKIISRNGFYDGFDKIFLSYEIGYMKPSVEAFKTVLDYYQLNPGEVLFVDDNPKNVDAAVDMGMTGILFTDAQTVTKSIRQVFST